jgi:hypothetical protein
MSYSGNVTVGGPADTRELPGLSITKVAVGPMDNNAYLLRCTQTGELALIDAARAGGLGGPLDGPGAEGARQPPELSVPITQRSRAACSNQAPSRFSRAPGVPCATSGNG